MDSDTLYFRVVRYIAVRPRSQKEIIDYIKRKLKSADKNDLTSVTDLIDKIISRLSSCGLANDEEFTRWWVEQRATFRPKGKRALWAELRQKGIDEQIINQILADTIDELALAQQAIAKKKRFCQNLASPEYRQKIIAFLSRRGFSQEVIKDVVDSA